VASSQEKINLHREKTQGEGGGGSFTVPQVSAFPGGQWVIEKVRKKKKKLPGSAAGEYFSATSEFLRAQNAYG